MSSQTVRPLRSSNRNRRQQPPSPPQIINEEVLGRIDAAFQTVGNGLKEASDNLRREKQTALANLESAKADLERARTEVNKAKFAFDAAKNKVRAQRFFNCFSSFAQHN